MSDNKKDGSLDFRNIKTSQFGGAQTDRMEFSELQSSKRVFFTNYVLKDAYTHFIQTLDNASRPTQVEYWQATRPAIHRLQMSADVLGSKAGTYFTLQEYLTKKTHVFYYVVAGFGGTAPGIGDTETPINIAANSSAATIAFATNQVVSNVTEFRSTHPTVLTSYIDISYNQFGDTDLIDVGTSGFIATEIQAGDACLVGQVTIDYTIEGYPVYGGNTLKNHVFNVPEAKFDLEFDEIEVSAVANLDPLISKDPTVYNVSMPSAGTEYSLTFPIETKRFQLNIREHASKYTVAWTSGGDYLTKSPGTIYEETNLEIVAGKDTIYFTATKNNMVMEIIAWK